jgi:hypothetical protein
MVLSLASRNCDCIAQTNMVLYTILPCGSVRHPDLSGPLLGAESLKRQTHRSALDYILRGSPLALAVVPEPWDYIDGIESGKNMADDMDI